MSPTNVIRILTLSVAVVAALAAPRVVVAQADSDGAAPAAQSPTELMKDFLHYVRIAKPDLAEATGKALLDSGASDSDLAMIVIDNDLEEKLIGVLRRGRQMTGVSDLASRIERRVENGRIALARDPGLIEQSISMLTGSRSLLPAGC